MLEPHDRGVLEDQALPPTQDETQTPNNDQLYKLLLAHMKTASQERKEQTEAFKDSLKQLSKDQKESIEGIRRDFRVRDMVMILIIAALAGLNVAYNNGSLSLTHNPAPTPQVQHENNP